MPFGYEDNPGIAVEDLKVKQYTFKLLTQYAAEISSTAWKMKNSFTIDVDIKFKRFKKLNNRTQNLIDYAEAIDKILNRFIDAVEATGNTEVFPVEDYEYGHQFLEEMRKRKGRKKLKLPKRKKGYLIVSGVVDTDNVREAFDLLKSIEKNIERFSESFNDRKLRVAKSRLMAIYEDGERLYVILQKIGFGFGGGSEVFVPLPESYSLYRWQYMPRERPPKLPLG